MFTKNWYKATASAMFYMREEETYKTMSGGIMKISGNASHIQLAYPASGSQNPFLGNMSGNWEASAGVILGTGITPPTVDDYTMSGNPITNFTYSYALAKDTDDNGATITALYTITNTGSSAFTIGEIGLTASLGGSYSTMIYKALLERTVLDSPLTIEPGGVGQLTYVIRMDYPTA